MGNRISTIASILFVRGTRSKRIEILKREAYNVNGM